MKKGFTLIEILIVVAIMGLILVSIPLTINFKTQINKGYDTSRKNDLKTISTNLEEFYSDKDRYPIPAELCHNDTNIYVDVCDNTTLCCNICGKVETPSGIASYINPAPCDPQYSTKDYLYQIPSGGNPQWFKIYSKLSSPEVNFSPSQCENGCGPGGEYNLGVSSSNTSPD